MPAPEISARAPVRLMRGPEFLLRGLVQPVRGGEFPVRGLARRVQSPEFPRHALAWRVHGPEFSLLDPERQRQEALARVQMPGLVEKSPVKGAPAVGLTRHVTQSA